MKNKLDILPEWLVSEMKNTEQDKVYHAEGDVYTHSLMVYDEIKKLKNNFTPREYEILSYSAILHDIGKVKTTVLEDDGRITSKGHSKVGYYLALEILENVDLPFGDKLEIMNLVRYHGNPYNVFLRDELEREVITLSMQCNLKLLYHLAWADFKGRISIENLEDNFLLLNIFRECAENLDCFDRPYQFKSNIAKFNYLVRKSHHHLDEPYNDTKSKVYLMSGLPGSGKDYYVKKNFDIPVISLDEIRKELKIKPTETQGLVINTAKERAKNFLRKGEDFVWNATNTVKSTRDNLINLFTTYNAFITIIYISGNLNLNKILEQNKNRIDIVPEKVIRKLHRNLEIPTGIESHKIIYIK